VRAFVDMGLLASPIVISLSELVDELGGGGVHAGGLSGGGGVDLELTVWGGDFLELVTGGTVV
jgi:hypothetical protein